MGARDVPGDSRSSFQSVVTLSRAVFNSTYRRTGSLNAPDDRAVAAVNWTNDKIRSVYRG